MHNRGGFTLIEILVVVMIIGVLMALVVVTARMVTTSAHAAQCASNLRQLGVGLLAFSVDNRGQIPPPNIDNTAIAAGGPDLNGNGVKDAEEVGDYGNWWGFVRRYLPDLERSKVFLCPSGNWLSEDVDAQNARWYSHPDRHFEADCTWYQSSYGYNAALGHNKNDADLNDNPAVFPGSNRQWKSWRLIAISRVSETPAIADMWSIGEKDGENAVAFLPFFRANILPVNGTGAELPFSWDRMCAVRVSHRNASNHVFFDGSVRGVVPATLGAKLEPGYWDIPNAYRGKY
jgi:prepilin-type N-terminal cleavage/methylation domain-containing protein